VDNPNTVKPNLKKKLAARFHKRLMAEVTVNQKIAQHIKVLSEAIMEKKQVMLYDYASADSNSISPRLVEPYKFTTNYTDVWAYELSTNSNEIFRISRIGRVDLLQHFWDFEALHGAEFIDMFGIPGSSKQPIELILNVRSSFILQEEYPKSADYLKEIDHEHWLLETEVCSFLGIGRFVLGLMDDIEVIEPKEFVQFLKERLKNSQKKLKK
jgi:predicted DNA-binding transcriptional regulator YafY